MGRDYTVREAGEIIEAVRSVLHRTGSNGKPIFLEEQIEHFIPFALLAGAPREGAGALPQLVLEKLGKLAAVIGIREGAGADQIATAAAEYYRRFPVHPALLAEYRRAISMGGDEPRWELGARALIAILVSPGPKKQRKRRRL